MAEDSAYGIVSGERDFDWGVLEQLGDELNFFSYIGKFCPFLCVLLFLFTRMFDFIGVYD